MKKFLSLAGLVMTFAFLSACSNNSRAQNEKNSNEDNSSNLVSVTLDNGETVKVDAFTAEHYIPFTIEMALKREATASKIVRPKDASAFGKKKLTAICKTINQYDRPYTETGEPNGTVTVVHYEKGVEVIRDGKSWFYDYDNFCYGEPDFFEYAAAESVLHPGVWEPVLVSVDDGDLIFTFVYGSSVKKPEFLSFREAIRVRNKINHTSDIQISVERF